MTDETDIEPAGVAPESDASCAMPQPSYYQERLWFLTRLHPRLTAFNAACAVRFCEPIDVDRLRAACTALMGRHSILRTRYPAHGDNRVVTDCAPSACVVRVCDPGKQTSGGAAGIAHVLESEVWSPFDYDKGPLLRIVILPMGTASTCVAAVLHRLVGNESSARALLRELLTEYGALTRGAGLQTASVPPQFVEFSARQRATYPQDSPLDLPGSWKRALKLGSAQLALPTDFPRPAVKTYAGGSVIFEFPDLPPALHLHEGAGAAEDLASMLLGAFFVQLSRYTRQEDFMVGVRTSFVPSPLGGGPLGPGDNYVPLCGVLHDDPTWNELHSRVRHQWREAMEASAFPFERVIAEAHPGRETSHSPLFQAEFSYEEWSWPSAVPAESVVSIELGSSVCPVDIGLHCRKTESGVRCRLEYSADLFHEATVQRMAGHFTTLLRDALACPERVLSALRLVDDAERRLAIEGFNRTQVDYPLGKRLHDLLDVQAAATPDRPAVQFEGSLLTYRQFTELANRLAHQLRRQGVGRNVLVGVCMERSMELVLALHAILRAGGAYVPLDPSYPKARLAGMVEDARPVLILAHQGALEILEGVNTSIVLIGSLLEEAAQAPCTTPETDTTSNDLAYVIFTSGSTGRPKGAMNAHRGICNRLLWMQDAYHLDERDAVLQKTPFSFDVSVWEFFWPLLAGARLVVARPEGHKDPAYLAGAIRTQGITTVHFVPSMLRAFLDHPLAASCTGLTRVVCSGEALPRELQDRFHGTLGAGLYNLYGPTEAAVDVTAHTCVAGAKETLVPIGRPVANTSIYILDARLEPVPVGVPGELYIGGVQVGLGYINKPGLTAERFVPDPFIGCEGARMYRTGDLARFRPEGVIEFLGRLDHQVKIRGQRIELEEIEAALMEHPGVEAAVVQVRGESTDDQRLVAYVVPEGSVPSEELRAGLRLRLPSYMIPDIIVGLDALPLLANGKLDRRSLPEPERAQRASSRVFAAPQTGTEKDLAHIWADLLRVPSVGCADDFFDLGGHSLLALRVLNRVRDLYGIDVPLADVFDCRTLMALAYRIDTLRNEGRATALPAPTPVKRDRSFPLTYAQEQLWFLEQLNPGLTAYNIPVVLRLRGTLNESALRASFAFLAGRHEPLRTTFPAPEGVPCQVVHPSFDIPLKVTRPAALNSLEEHVSERLRTLAQTPFDLENGPLWRVDLIYRDEHDCVLCFVFHHIIFDGWSVGPFVADLTHTYSAFVRGESPSLHALRLQEADYAVWQHGVYGSERMEESLSFWKQKLKDAPPSLALPTSHPRIAEPGFRGDVVSVRMPKDTVQTLRDISREAGGTLYSSLLTLWHLLLKRYTGQHDIVSGSGIAGRDWTALEPAVGFFVNTVVMRTRVSEEVSLREAIRATHNVVMEVREHQHASFKKIVETVCPERDAARSPLFQVVFVLQNMPPVNVHLEGLDGTHVYQHNGGAKFDLVLEADERGDELELRLEYATGLFDAPTAQRMLDHFHRLVLAAASQPAASLRDLDMLSNAERGQVLSDFNRTACDYPRNASIPQLFEAVAERFGASVALSTGDTSMTYAALNARANQLAAYLMAQGIGRDALVGLCVDRSIEAIVAILGILKSGGAYLPLDSAYPEARLRQILDDARPPLVIVEDAAAPRLASTDTKVLSLSRLQEDASRYSPVNLTPASGPNDLAYVMYTSGSTGVPKGVCVEHHNVVRLVCGADYASFGPEEVFLQFAPLPFDASTFEIWGALLHGARLAIAPPGPLSLDRLGEVIERERVTTAWLTAGLFHQMVDAVLGRLRGLRQLLAGGDVLSPAHVRRVLEVLPGIRVINGYGPTECTTFACCHPMCRPEEVEEPVSIGRPIANTRVYVLDESMHPVPVGAVGELHIGGDGVARGYLNRPELTAERFVPDPFQGDDGARVYRTGDAVRFLPDGRLQFLGRKDQQVKIRGFRVELGEIESVLAACPAVKEAAVITQPDANGDKRLIAYVTPRQVNGHATPAVRDFLNEQLPAYMIPSIIMWLEGLPLNPNGKVDRAALPAPNQPDVREYCPPATEPERVLAGIWAELLKVDRIGRNEDFFALGGHSLIATQMVYRIQDAFGIQFPLRKVFECGTVAALAEAVEEAVIEHIERSSGEHV
ncbi:MAG: amino acid adenylation domain-containing protein [Candidatus Hydrogenedentes bacterium]|nr:amino acid adenylation domain-containing protein [Candidatus Hydrogenedentota bacterium]